ncbi:MAG: hypothetical protein U0169_15535 [Polyangiaceae bacterium]
MLVPSPGMDLHLDPYEVTDTRGAPAARYLATSPEYQMKRLLADGHARIVQISKCFRKGELGVRHNPSHDGRVVPRVGVRRGRDAGHRSPRPHDHGGPRDAGRRS